MGRLGVVGPVNVPVRISRFTAVRESGSPSLLRQGSQRPTIALASSTLNEPSKAMTSSIITCLGGGPLPGNVRVA